MVLSERGAIFTSFGAGIPKKGLNRDAAYFYLNEMLEPQAAGKIGELTSYPPSTTNAEMPDEIRRPLRSRRSRSTFNFVDYG